MSLSYVSLIKWFFYDFELCFSQYYGSFMNLYYVSSLFNVSLNVMVLL